MSERVVFQKEEAPGLLGTGTKDLTYEGVARVNSKTPKLRTGVKVGGGEEEDTTGAEAGHGLRRP